MRSLLVVYTLRDANDLGALHSFSTEFLRRCGIDVDLDAPQGASGSLQGAIVDGYTDALQLPPADWQYQHTSELAACFGTVEDGAAPLVEAHGLRPVGRPSGGYLLLLHADPRADDDLRGLTAPGLRRALANSASLTVTEYLICRRAMLERHGDHRFYDYAGDPSGWMWLADSSDGARTAMAYWNPSRARVEVTACRTGSKNPRKGARRARIIPLETV